MTPSPTTANGAGGVRAMPTNKAGGSQSSTVNLKKFRNWSAEKIEMRNLALEKLNALGAYEFEEDYDFDMTTAAEFLMVVDDVTEEANPKIVRSTMLFPLSQSYSFFFQDMFSIMGAKKTGKYEVGLEKICDVSTVQDFWRLWNQLQEGFGAMSLFKQGVRPLWEDPANKTGGRWVLAQVAATDRFPAFTELCLAFIGGLFRDILEEADDEILGVTFSLFKKAWKVEMWNKNGSSTAIREIDLRIRNILDVQSRDAFSIKYSSHDGSRTETWITVSDSCPQEECPP
ncbi:unnamed protein product [Amoebophrya sp. A120]|nr:unnamed protein product [Amoebophrya sp. A120]|eukprot:GSA120T00018758001.1